MSKVPNGFYALKINGENAEACFVDEETCDFAELNRKTRDRRKKQEEDQAELYRQACDKLAYQNSRMEMQSIRHKEVQSCVFKTVCRMLISTAIIALLTVLMHLDLVDILVVQIVASILVILNAFWVGSSFCYIKSRKEN